ncbi:hypothetical protein FOA52_014883 [Chlamydomonas sp. UWO 241]|nr:hypothetical protein FOA52_014883 [Chlamydomonas sp. UWO 241]
MYDSKQDAARAFDCAAVKLFGPDYAKRNFPGEIISEPPVSRGDKWRAGLSSRFKDVCWTTSKAAWQASLWDPKTKRQHLIGFYASEEDAARAYDCAAVKALGSGTELNFPGEATGEPPASLGDEWRESQSLSYLGASAEDAARVYDFAAVKLLGRDTKRNFAGELSSEPPVTVGEHRKERKSSRYNGVSINTAQGVWEVHVWNPQTKRSRSIGCYTTEEEAARAYDCEAVKLFGPDYSKRNFPDELISEPPVSRGEAQKERKSSRFIGVRWNKKA